MHSFSRSLVVSPLCPLTNVSMGPRRWVSSSGRAYAPKWQHTVYFHVPSENPERHQQPRGRRADIAAACLTQENAVESKDPRGQRGLLVCPACAREWSQLLYTWSWHTVAWTRCLQVQESYDSEVVSPPKVNVLAKGLRHDNVERW